MYDIYLKYYILMGCGMFVKLHLGYAECSPSQCFLRSLWNQPLGPSLRTPPIGTGKVASKCTRPLYSLSTSCAKPAMNI